MNNKNAVTGVGMPASLTINAIEKLGKQVTHIIENLPAGLEMTVNLARGNASVSLGFNAEELSYADLLAGDALYEELSQTLSMVIKNKSGGPGLIVEKNHLTSSPTAAIAMLEQLLQDANKKIDAASQGLLRPASSTV